MRSFQSNTLVVREVSLSAVLCGHGEECEE